jgi:hypothetical protein
MANEEQLERIREGVDVWNAWRKEKYDEIKEPDLRGADLSAAKLHKANLFGAILYKSKLIGADLREANLRGASLIEADLTNADLSGADLRWAQIIGTTLFDATLTGSRVYGVSVWDIKVNHLTKQQNLIITDRVKVNDLTKQQNSIKTDPGEPEITVDDIKVAQFVHLLLEHQEIRNVIDTITSKAVLILGRFGGGGIEVLREVAEALRKRKYLPIIFDFKRPTDRSFTGTVQTLVGLSRFVIVDLSGPSVPQELYSTVPHFKLPFVPILERSLRKYSMFPDLLEYPWVLRPIVEFSSTEELLGTLQESIVAPAEARVAERRQQIAELFGRRE